MDGVQAILTTESHPTGVRGLKFTSCYNAAEVDLSHPTGVRGLKFVRPDACIYNVSVAPHWGAWIEIRPRSMT